MTTQKNSGEKSLSLVCRKIHSFLVFRQNGHVAQYVEEEVKMGNSGLCVLLSHCDLRHGRVCRSSQSHCHLKGIPSLEKTNETSGSLQRTVSHSLSLWQPAPPRGSNDVNMLQGTKSNQPYQRG